MKTKRVVSTLISCFFVCAVLLNLAFTTTDRLTIQHSNFNPSQANSLFKFEYFTNPNVVRDLVVDKGFVYSATLGGMVAWNLTDGSAKPFTTGQGMSHISATTITACDLPEHRILVGTLSGVSIYDPSTELWQKESLFPEDSKIATSRLGKIYCDQKNNRLLVGSNGLGMLNLKTREWSKLTTAEGLGGNEIYDLAINGNEIWIASGMYGIAKISGAQITIFNKESGMPDGFASAIAIGADKSVWVGTPSGLLQFKSNKWKLYGSDLPAKLTSISEIEIDTKGKVWAATAPLGIGRVCQFDPKTGECVVELQGGWSEAIMALALDAKGQPIFGSDFGVYASDGQLTQALIVDGTHLSSNFVDSISQGSGGTLWIGTDGGTQQMTPSFPDKEWLTVTTRTTPDAGGNWASAAAISQDSSMWFAMMNGSASHYASGKWTTFPDIRNYEVVAVDNQKRAWFGDDSKGITVINPDGSLAFTLTQTEGLPGNRINALLQDGSVMWIGTENGLARYANNQVDIILEKGDERLPYPYIRDLSLDQNHNLLIGSTLNIVRWNGQMATTLLDFPKVGITEWLTELVVDPSGRIWVGTAGKGIFYSETGEQWNHLGAENGLLTNFISAMHVDETGAIWVGGGGSNFDGGGLLKISY